MFSIQALVLIGAIQGIFATLTPDMLASTIPGTIFTWGGLGAALTVLAAVLGAVGRLIDQPSTVGPK